MAVEREPTDLRRLTELVARLRRPDGCPWDREQGLADLRPFLLEEAHEAAAALDTGDWEAIAGELGDLLFQVAFIVRLGEEAGNASLGDVVDRIESKMIARHPHVFGDATAADAAEVRRAWERRKAAASDASVLAGVPDSLPALVAASRMTQKAAGVGFDWPTADAVRHKLDEELAELATECAAVPPDGQRVADELGDTLFTLVNLARHLGVDPEGALARSNRKFRRRFQRLEALLTEGGGSLADADPRQLEALWEQVKSDETAASP
jgi:nucleoside triphosphate diphosphatase